MPESVAGRGQNIWPTRLTSPRLALQNNWISKLHLTRRSFATSRIISSGGYISNTEGRCAHFTPAIINQWNRSCCFGNILFTQEAFKMLSRIWRMFDTKGAFKRATFIVLVFLKSWICTWLAQHGKSVVHVDRGQHQQTFFFGVIITTLVNIPAAKTPRAWVFLRLHTTTYTSLQSLLYLHWHRPLETQAKPAMDPSISESVSGQFRLRNWWVEFRWRPPMKI